ncbi:hypothetical protein NliqN6_1733 [Naganishia liquefaciens]|uniref:Major facilitator superfamily (MFS) profile domain-containing protein n=1 Tax=Naganishia liquefaciens TaxID=104408 RepID=A0A8H3YF41_9TREE|nr:hypothetical protein NliqN6_1733 [Naganishia liquefaciens]
MSDTNGHYRAPDTTYPLGDKDKDPAVVDEKAAQQGFAHDGLIPPPDSYDPYSAQPAAHRGVGALFRGELGSEVSTPFERKAALINRELDKMGFGRYQLAIWFLCGFGYFLDLMWAQAVGLIATPIYQEMNVNLTTESGLIFTAMSAGLTAGAFFFGLLVDIIGRKWAFNLTCLITCVFGTLIAAPVYNYDAICAMAALTGFGLGGQIPIDATITLEFLPQSKRYLLALLSLWQPVGVVVACAIAYGFVPKYRCNTDLDSCMITGPGEACCSTSSNMGWRYLMITLGGITLSVFFLRFFIFNFRESPKFLLGKGKEQQAIDVLHSIAKFNRAPPPTLTIEDFQAIDQEMSVVSVPESVTPLNTPLKTRQLIKNVIMDGIRKLRHLKGLFQTPLMAFTTVIVWIAYMGDFWSFNIAGSYLPIILNNRNVSSGQNSVYDTYEQYIIIYAPGIIGCVIAMLAIQLPVLGRKWSLVLSAALQGLSMAMYTQVRSTAGYVGLNALEYIMQSFFNAVLYATTPEMFPAYVRGSACGLASTLGRLSGIVAPFAAQKYVANESAGVLWLATGGIWVAMVALIFLPIETRNRQAY